MFILFMLDFARKAPFKLTAKTSYAAPLQARGKASSYGRPVFLLHTCKAGQQAVAKKIMMDSSNYKPIIYGKQKRLQRISCHMHLGGIWTTSGKARAQGAAARWRCMSVLSRIMTKWCCSCLLLCVWRGGRNTRCEAFLQADGVQYNINWRRSRGDHLASRLLTSLFNHVQDD